MTDGKDLVNSEGFARRKGKERARFPFSFSFLPCGMELNFAIWIKRT